MNNCIRGDYFTGNNNKKRRILIEFGSMKKTKQIITKKRAQPAKNRH